MVSWLSVVGGCGRWWFYLGIGGDRDWGGDDLRLMVVLGGGVGGNGNANGLGRDCMVFQNISQN